MRDSFLFVIGVSFLDFLLKFDLFEAFLTKATTLCKLLCTDIEVENKIGLDKTTVSTETPIEVKSLKQELKESKNMHTVY